MRAPALIAAALASHAGAAQAEGEPVAAPPSAADVPGEQRPQGTTVRTTRPRPPDSVAGRATQHVTRWEIDERQPRSAPEALRYVPGVYVQQTSHGQASPYIRGLTGYRTLVLVDGLRLNNALWRQGPNQYFFTVDLASADSLEVVRGSSSVELGAGAMGGAILVHPVEPTIDPSRQGVHVRPHLALLYASADDALGAPRVQIDAQLSRSTGVLAGVGYVDRGPLQGAGPVEGVRPYASEEERLRNEVPRFDDDGRTQRGTGYRALTADARLVHRPSERARLTLAAYTFRQFDSPRTDQCPAPEAPDDWCLMYEEQFRTQVYGRSELGVGWAGLQDVDASFGFQRQHERRRNDQVFVNGGIDDVDVWSGRLRARTASWRVGEGLRMHLLYGLDGSRERVASQAWQTLDFSRSLPGSDTAITRHSDRGRYVDGSRYAQGGAWASSRLDLGRQVTLRLGGRTAVADVFSPEQPASDTLGVEARWWTAIGHAGVEWRPRRGLTLLAGVEQGFRPANLDDLTGRQVTGQGFQIDNPHLVPEETLTLELGSRWSGRALSVEGWVFQIHGEHWMDRDVFPPGQCPESLRRECTAARWAQPVKLVNLPGTALIRGAELQGKLRLPWGLRARGTLSYAWGEGDSPLAHEPGVRRPLSRVAPLHGTLEGRWRHPGSGLYLGAAMRWARTQDRLSFGDINDKRVPPGGTPGHVVFDVRAGLRLGEHISANAVLENLGDAAYRIHGSSVNGPGRGILLNLEIQP